MDSEMTIKIASLLTLAAAVLAMRWVFVDSKRKQMDAVLFRSVATVVVVAAAAGAAIAWKASLLEDEQVSRNALIYIGIAAGAVGLVNLFAHIRTTISGGASSMPTCPKCHQQQQPSWDHCPYCRAPTSSPELMASTTARTGAATAQVASAASASPPPMAAPARPAAARADSPETIPIAAGQSPPPPVGTPLPPPGLPGPGGPPRSGGTPPPLVIPHRPTSTPPPTGGESGTRPMGQPPQHETMVLRRGPRSCRLAWLAFAEGPRTGDEIRLSKSTVLGTDSDECNAVVSDGYVSRQHAIIEHANDRYAISDLGSTNGTRVNGDDVMTQDLNDKDIIEIGETRLVFLEVNWSEAESS